MTCKAAEGNLLNQRYIEQSLKGLLSFLIVLLFASCEKEESGVLDSQGVAPILSVLSISPSKINTDTINIGPTRQPGDILNLVTNAFASVRSSAGVKGISRVEYLVRNHEGSTSLSSGLLLDDGVSPDAVAGDSVYSGKVQFQIVRSTIGTLFVEITAEGTGGYHSNTFVLPLEIVRANQPPLLSNLDAPDTIRASTQGETITLHITAVDTDGKSDILRVQFNSYKPDGSPSSGNPFQMYNDGDVASHGDISSLDDIYSLIIVSPPAPSDTVSYRFEFQAFDRSNVGSNIIIKRITVVP